MVSLWPSICTPSNHVNGEAVAVFLSLKSHDTCVCVLNSYWTVIGKYSKAGALKSVEGGNNVENSSSLWPKRIESYKFPGATNLWHLVPT